MTLVTPKFKSRPANKKIKSLYSFVQSCFHQHHHQHQHQHQRIIMNLPIELVLQTFHYLNKADLKRARLVSKFWSRCASKDLFTKLFISPHELNLQVFVSVARDPVLSGYVKELEYDAVDFSPHLAISEYFKLLWYEMSWVIACHKKYSYYSHDPQIDHFVTLLRESRDFRGNLIGGRECMVQAQAQCCDYAFVQEGYRQWMEQAAFEKKTSEDFTLLKLLIAGLKRFTRLRVVKMRGEWSSGDKLRVEGSPLARSWHPFYAHPGRWLFGPDQLLKESCAAKDFWTLAYALTEPGKTASQRLSLESPLPPAAFITKPSEKQTHVDCGVAAYCKVEDLKLSLAGYGDQPKLDLYDNLHGLRRMLESMTALKRFELDLPDDYVNDPAIFFPYTKIFPKNGHWPQLTTFTVRNLAIGTTDLITLLMTRMPCLRHLFFGNIDLIDGKWQGLIEYLRVSHRLSTFEVDPFSLLFHCGGQDFTLQRPYPSPHSRRYQTSMEFLESIGTYVVEWWHNPSLRHPSLRSGQEARKSLDYLPDVFRLCEMREEMSDTMQELTDHMLEEAVRYREWRKCWMWRNCIEDFDGESPTQ